MSKHAVVVGAGAIGVASAYYLGKSGWQVTVVDQGDIGAGCSQGNAGLIVPSSSHPLPGPGVPWQALRWMFRKDSPFYIRPRSVLSLAGWLWRFRRYCNSQHAEHGFRALLALSSANFELMTDLADSQKLQMNFQAKGLLRVYLTEAGAAGAAAEAKHLEGHGFKATPLSQGETLQFEPSLNDNVKAGLFIEGEAHADSYEYVRSLAAASEKLGVELKCRRGVSRMLTDGRKIAGVVVDSPQETISADLVVLAAGAWTPQIAKTLGIGIPIRPAKGYSCTIDSYPGAPAVPVLLHEKKVIITPLGEKLRFAGTLELGGFDRSVPNARYEAVVQASRSVLDEPPSMDHEEAWCGLRPLTPDGLPIIDRAPGFEGLIIAAGHAMLGFSQSAITGKLVAELANDTHPSVDLTPFRLDRF